MAKRQNFIVGSTNAVSETLTDAELNTAWNRFEILGAGKLDGVFKAVSDYSNDSSNEIANAIQSITGTEPTGGSESELANALQQMRSEIETTSLTFKGYVSTTEPSSNDYVFVEGNLWINASSMPTVFPVSASDIKQWNGTAWVAYGSTYTPADFDFFRNVNDNEGYYWFGGVWTIMSTDMSTTYFTLNQNTGKWEIKQSVNLPGNPTTTTPSDPNDNSAAISTTEWVQNNTNTMRTDCVTEIPQDIKLELNAGTLTLKAGSKVYVPNGAGVFDEITVAADVILDSSLTSTYGNGNYTWFYNPTLNKIQGGNDNYNQCQSGTYDGNQYCMFYDTTINVIKYTSNNGSTWEPGYSLPFGFTTLKNGVGITSINQIFNGFGYIGSTVFALPGVKGLIPNFRNADGTLKSIEFTTQNVSIRNIDANWNNQEWFFTSSGSLGWYPLQAGEVKYDENLNIWIDTRQASGISYYCSIGRTLSNNGKITSFTPKTAFHAVDYYYFNKMSSTVNNIIKITSFMLPSSSNSYSWFIKWSNGMVLQGQQMDTMNKTITLSIPMANTNYFIGGVGFVISGPGQQSVSNITTTGFKTSSNVSNSGTRGWFVFGQYA